MSCSLDEFLSKHGLKITQNPISHRTITTINPIRAGTTIVKSYPLAAFPLPTYEKELCNQCLKNTKLQACSACKKAYYCSTICQKQAWFTQHKFICKKQQHPKYENVVEGAELDEEMLRRVALLISSFQCSHNNRLGDSKLNKVCDILPKEMNITLLIEVFETLQSHKESHPHHTLLYIDKLVSYLCRFGCNNFTIHDKQMFGIGEGTYPIGSLFNHSCRPNAVVMYDGNVQIVRCIEDVNAGEEIAIAYLDVVHPRKKRREILREKYFFECHCRKCGDDDKIIDGKSITTRGFQDIYVIEKIDVIMEKELNDSLDVSDHKQRIVSELENLKKHFGDHELIEKPPILFFLTNLVLSSILPQLDNRFENYIQAFDTLLNSIHFYLSSSSSDFPSVLNPFSIDTLPIVASSFYEFEKKQEWNDAVSVGKIVLAIYLIAYPRFHPMIGWQLFRLGQCMSKCVKDDDIGGGKMREETLVILRHAKR
ncbi:2405_t:CDS:2 [Ambispora leptoticha]|uniref:2405_t:CDS:1 n=1 Tax=Ambispora leptoticha TaxID=144679 RepID=A0A9N9F5I5_9GLOM|nr:2405_t:CDS:2 [Ambispora leptoticha]